MNLDRNQSHTLKLISENMKYIREESESKSSSMIMNEDEPSDPIQPKRKEQKIHFGDILEKQFEEEAYEDQEEEAEEQPYLHEEEYVLTVDDIRDQINKRKLKIEESLKKIHDIRLNQRKAIKSIVFESIKT